MGLNVVLSLYVTRDLIEEALRKFQINFKVSVDAVFRDRSEMP